jgi:hypothetical protein
MTQGTLPFPEPHPPAVACYRPDGTRLLLALDGIQGYWPTENPQWLHVKMSVGKEPILVVCTMEQMDAAIAACMNLHPSVQLRPELRRVLGL